MSNINYARVNWKDYPNTDTPHNAANLNKMDKAISDIVTNMNANGNTFDFAYDITSQRYGYNIGGTFYPFKTAHTGTYTPTSRSASLDMGEDHTYRFVDTNSVPNSNSSTFNVTSNGTHDMGATNNFRYVGANVPFIERVFTGYGTSCNFGYTTDPNRVWVAYCSTGGTFSVGATGVTFNDNRAYVVVIFTANAVHKVINGGIVLGIRSSGNVDLGGWYDTSKIGVSLSMNQFRVTALGNNYVTIYNADNGYRLSSSYSIVIFK